MSDPEACFAFFDLPYGPVTFPPRIAKLTRTREFARIHEIKQLSTIYLLYPYATHTRADHSLGVASLIDFYIRSLPMREFSKIAPADRYCLLVSGLLHDIGHPAWSHVGEEFTKFFEEETISHDVLSAGLIVGDRKFNRHYEQWDSLPSVSEILKEEEKKQKIQLRKPIARLVLGLTPFAFRWRGKNPPRQFPKLSKQEKRRQMVDKAWMGKMVHSELDFDRADYLRRDSYFTLGLPGLSDPISLVELVKIDRTHDTSGLAFLDLPFAEGFFIGHELMYPAVYVKAKNLVLEELLQRALYKTFPDEERLYDFWFSTDEQVLEKMRKKSRENNLVKRVCNLIDTREIYQTLERDFSQLSVNCRNNLDYLECFKCEILQIEQEVRDACSKIGLSIKEEDMVLGISKKTKPKGAQVIIQTERGRKTLADESPLLNTMSSLAYQTKKSRLVLGFHPRFNIGDKNKIFDKCISIIESKKYDLTKIEKKKQKKREIDAKLKRELGGDW